MTTALVIIGIIVFLACGLWMSAAIAKMGKDED